MKTRKKHSFKYTDPEKKPIENTRKETKKKTIDKKPQQLVPDYVNRDLKRTLIIIGIFLAILVIIYIIQLKTEILNPIRQIFNL